MPPATLKQLGKRLRLLACYGNVRLPYEQQDDWQRQAHPWRCTLIYKRRRFSFDYWMGQALDHDPQVDDVLENLLSDASAGDQDFEDFCSDFGYDLDSRKAHRTWLECQRLGKKLKRLLGEDFALFQSAER